MYSYAPRVSIPAKDLSSVIEIWSTSCQSIIAYEHEADEEVTTTHCHILMEGSKYATAEQYKRQLYECLPNEKRKGNELWAWSHKDFKKPDSKFIGYMNKNGKSQKVYNKGYTEEVITTAIDAWKDKQHEYKTKEGTHESFTDRMIHQTVMTYRHYQKISDAFHDINIQDYPLDQQVDYLFTAVRRTAFSEIWHDTGKVPVSSVYKQVAGSAFMKLCEKYNVFNYGMSKLLDKWY